MIIISTKPSESARRNLGQNHYSWNIVANKFATCFSRNSIKWKYIDNIQRVNPRNMHRYGIEEGDLHLSFAPFESIRICKASKNIAHLAWEYSNFPSTQTGNSFSNTPGNPMHFLNSPVIQRLDQIWVGCSFTQAAFQKYTDTPIHIVPAPISLNTENKAGSNQGGRKVYIQSRGLRRIESIFSSSLKQRFYPLIKAGHRFAPLFDYQSSTPTSLSEVLKTAHQKDGRVFGCILNPHDWRKNLFNMVCGFSMALPFSPGSVLLLKFACQETPGQIYSELLNWALAHTHAANFPNIYFTTDYIDEDLMKNFLSCLDFYLCASNCEGQNLPLLEAMGCGVVPVSTSNTAMADYIRTDHAFVIDSSIETIDMTAHPNPMFWGLNWWRSRPANISEGIKQALAASDQELARMSRDCVHIVREGYSNLSIAKKVQRLTLPLQ